MRTGMRFNHEITSARWGDMRFCMRHASKSDENETIKNETVRKSHD